MMAIKEASREEAFKLAYGVNPQFKGYLHFAEFKKVFDWETGETQMILGREWSCRIDEVSKYVKKNQDRSRAHYGMANTTVTHVERDKEHLFSLNNIVIDVDCHDATMDVKKRDELLGEFVSVLEEELVGKVDIWNLAHMTGRGIQFWWCLEQVSRVLSFAWTNLILNLIETIEKVLEVHPEFSALKVDTGASKNLVGYFRLFDSYNPVAMKRTKTYIYNSSVYKLEDLERQLDSRKSYAMGEQVTRYRVTGWNFLLLLSKKRMGAVGSCIKVRKRKKGEELRNNNLFIFYISARGIYNADTAQEKARELNTLFIEPMDETSLQLIFKYIDRKYERDGCYKLTNLKIIELLGLTEAEQELLNIKPHGTVWDWNECRPNRTRDAERKGKRNDRNSRVISLYLAGMTQEQVAQDVGLTRKTVSGILSLNNINKKTERIRQIQLLKLDKSTQKEVAELLDVSLRTVKVYWNVAA